MRRLGPLLAISLASSGCASDVVLKPAVNDFVNSSRTAVSVISKSYEDLIIETNKSTAMFLAANPDCGFSTSIFARDRRIDDLLRSWRARSAANRLARMSGTRAPLMPAETYCVTPFEARVLGEAYPHAKTSSVPLQIMDAAEFKPQLDTVQALTDYVAVLARLADAPKLEAKDEILGVASKLRGILTDIAPLAGKLGANADTIQGIAADKGVIQSYASAVADLADTIELIAKQEQDVRGLRAKLLDPDNHVGDLMAKIGKEADRWNGQHRLARQSMVLSAAEGITPELPKLSFQERTNVFSSFIQEVSTALPSRAASSPYGAMMVALADAHRDLQRIARQEYTPKERRAIAGATLERLTSLLKGIAGVATLFI